METSKADRPTAAHRALIISNIQRLAFDVRNPEQNFLRPLGNLVSVALTCHAFLEAALDLIWENLKNLESLFYVWVSTGVIGNSSRLGGLLLGRAVPLALRSFMLSFNWVRKPGPADWERLLYYSRRVRSLNAAGSSSSSIFPQNFFTVFNAALQARKTFLLGQEPHQFLFQRLDTLVWSGAYVEKVGAGQNYQRAVAHLDNCIALLQEAPRLSSFDGIAHPSFWPALLPQLHTYGSQLHNLSIRSQLFARHQYLPSIVKSLLPILHLNALHTITIPSYLLVVSDVQHAVFRIPGLKVLEVNRYHWTGSIHDLDFADVPLKVHPENQTVNDDQVLNAVQTLRGTFKDLPGLVEIVVFGHLREIVVTQTEVPVDWNFLRAFLRAVGNSCPALEEYSSTTTVVNGGDDVPSEIFALAHLRECAGLSTLQFNLQSTLSSPLTPVPNDFNPTNEEWSSLAGSWPALRSVVYGSHSETSDAGSLYCIPFQPAPRATTAALANLVAQCPNIYHVDIPFHVKKGETIEVSAKASFEVLSVVQACIEDDSVVDMVAFLRRLVASPRFRLQIPEFVAKGGIGEGYGDGDEGTISGLVSISDEKRRCDAWAMADRRFSQSSGNSLSG